MEYVNIHGDVVNTTQKAVKKKAPPKIREAMHKGWLAVGFSPTQIKDAETEHRRTGTAQPFGIESYMRTHTPSKIRTKPYFSASSAEEACRLAEKDGWMGCHTRAQEKGGQ